MPLQTDIVDFAIDADGNFTFVNGQWQFTSGGAAVAQSQRIHLLNVKGEWFDDLDDGVPYIERDGVLASEALLSQKFSRTKAIAAFTSALLESYATTSVDEIDVEFDDTTRICTCNYSTTTIWGDTVADSLTRQL